MSKLMIKKKLRGIRKGNDVNEKPADDGPVSLNGVGQDCVVVVKPEENQLAEGVLTEVLENKDQLLRQQAEEIFELQKKLEHFQQHTDPTPDDIRYSYDKLVKENLSLKEELEDMKELFNVDPEHISEDTNIEVLVSQLRGRILSLEKINNEIKEHVKNQSRTIQELKQTQKTHSRKLETELCGAKQDYNVVESALRDTKEQLTSELISLRKKYSEIVATRSSLDVQLLQANKDKEAFEQERDVLKKEIVELQDQLGLAKTEAELYKEDFLSERKDREKAHDLKEEMRLACDQKVHALTIQLETEHLAHEESIQTLSKKLDQVDTEKDRLQHEQNIRGGKQHIKEQVQQKNKEIQELQDQLYEARQKAITAQEEVQAKTAQVKQYKKKDDQREEKMIDLQKRNEELTQEMERVRKELVRAKTKEGNMLQEERKASSKEMEKVRLELEKALKTIEQLSKTKKLTKPGAREELVKVQEDNKSLREDIETLRSSLREAQKEVADLQSMSNTSQSNQLSSPVTPATSPMTDKKLDQVDTEKSRLQHEHNVRGGKQHIREQFQQKNKEIQELQDQLYEARQKAITAQEEVQAKTAQVKQYKKKDDQREEKLTSLQKKYEDLFQEMERVRMELVRAKTQQENKLLEERRSNSKEMEKIRQELGKALKTIELLSKTKKLTKPEAHEELVKVQQDYEKLQQDNESLQENIEILKSSLKEAQENFAHLQSKNDFCDLQSTSNTNQSNQLSSSVTPATSPITDKMAHGGFDNSSKDCNYNYQQHQLNQQLSLNSQWPSQQYQQGRLPLYQQQSHPQSPTPQYRQQQYSQDHQQFDNWYQQCHHYHQHVNLQEYSSNTHQGNQRQQSPHWDSSSQPPSQWPATKQTHRSHNHPWDCQYNNGSQSPWYSEANMQPYESTPLTQYLEASCSDNSYVERPKPKPRRSISQMTCNDPTQTTDSQENKHANYSTDTDTDEDSDSKGLDTEIHEMVVEVVHKEYESDKRQTIEQIPFDPNLVCPVCRKQFRKGEIQKFRKHAKKCAGEREKRVKEMAEKLASDSRPFSLKHN